MQSFTHTPPTRLMAYTAVAFSAARSLTTLAWPASSSRTRALHRDGAGERIFRPLPDEPAARATNPELDWLQVAHYRPVP